jgi:hypothetical protein
MSPPSPNGAVRAKESALASLTEKLPDPQDREWFAGLVSYVNSLPEEDEFVKIAQLFGFLTLIGRELPENLEQERQHFRKLLLDAHGEFKKQIQTNANYHDKLTERLNQLPQEIADGVKPEAIAKSMAEAFRQQIAATGIQETKTILSAATTDLKKVTRELDAAVQPITDRYGALSEQIQRQAAIIGQEAGKLARTADILINKNAEQLGEIKTLNWHWYAVVAVVLLLIGCLTGITWEQRNVADLVGALQGQIAELQQTIKALTLTPAVKTMPTSAGKRPKKTR